jgi:hypothetical protein
MEYVNEACSAMFNIRQDSGCLGGNAALGGVSESRGESDDTFNLTSGVKI